MKKSLIVFFLLSVCFSYLNPLRGQVEAANYPFDTLSTYKIEMYDYSEFIGTFLYKDTTIIAIKTRSIPKIEMPIQNIKKITLVDPLNIRKGVYWFPNPNATRYLFGPTAFTFKKGEGYYQNTNLVLNSFNVGVTDNLSIGGGFEILSLLEGSGVPVFYLTSKVGKKVEEKFHLGGGLLFVSYPKYLLYVDKQKRRGAGILYGIGTYGTLDNNVTGGMGWGFVSGNFQKKPFITLSGMTRVARRMGLVSENLFFPKNDGYNFIISYGIRFFGKKMTVDLAFLNDGDAASYFVLGFPYADFVVKF